MFLSIDLYVDFLSGLRFSSIYSDDRFDVVCLQHSVNGLIGFKLFRPKGDFAVQG